MVARAVDRGDRPWQRRCSGQGGYRCSDRRSIGMVVGLYLAVDAREHNRVWLMSLLHVCWASAAPVPAGVVIAVQNTVDYGRSRCGNSAWTFLGPSQFVGVAVFGSVYASQLGRR